MAKKLSNNQLLMRECIKKECEENGQYSEVNAFFEFFAASQVLKNYDLSDDEVSLGITGGGNDGGCDGIFVFLNNDLVTQDQVSGITASRGSSLSLVIIQAKNETGFKEDAISNWKTVSENLLDMSSNIKRFGNRYSEQVKDSFMMFRDVLTKLITNQIKVSIQYYYVALGLEVHPNVRAQADELKALIVRMYPSANVDVIFVGADELMEMYNKETEICVNLEFAENPIARGKNSEYIALVNLKDYFKFITDENDILRRNFFEANVRDYQGKNSVNRSIAESLDNVGGEDFWWLNNGITILAERVTPVTAKELSIVNPEIVNGLQTSTEIYNYFRNDIDKLDKESRNVLVRVIVPETEETRDNIIFATNNQTNIPKSSLRVTDPLHLQIEMYLKNRGLYYDRRKNYYKNQKKNAIDIIGVSFLAQCLITIFLRKPDFARARPSTLLTDDVTYNNLYKNDVDLAVYYNTAILGRKVRVNLSKTAGMNSKERNDVLYYLLYAVCAKKLGKKDIEFSDIAAMDVESVSDDFINELKTLVYDKYRKLGGNSNVVKDSKFIEEIDSILKL